MTRHTPEESAVREQMRARDEGAAGQRETTTDGAGAAAGSDPQGSDPAVDEAPAAEAPPAEPTAEAPPAEPPAGGEEPEAAEEDQDPLAKAQAERDEYLDLARRAQADFENYRKRTAQQAAQAGERAKVGLLRELLPVVDNLERALAAAAEDEGPLAEGVKLVLTDLQGVLAREGIDTLEPVGERFDPTVHEALSTRAEDGGEAGVVVEVVEKGYRTRDSVIRPARVVVSA